MIFPTLTYLPASIFTDVQAHSGSGFSGIPIPSLPATELWVSWMFVGLAVLLLLTHFIDNYTIPECFNISFKVKERSSIFTKTTLQNPWAQSLFFVFQLFILALGAQVLLQQGNTPFQFMTMLRYVLFIGLFFLFKFLILKLLAFVFFHKNPNAALWIKTYFQCIGAYCFILFPILFLYIFVPEKYIIIPVILLIANTLALIAILLVKLFQLFFQKTLALFYLLLYLCTLEIFPVSGLIFLLKIST